MPWRHELVLAAHFTIPLPGGAGGRVVCQFLELSGLSAVVGTSYGSQQGLNAALEEAVVAVAGEPRAALAVGMALRSVTVCEDETFHPRICWVARSRCRGFCFRSRTRPIARPRLGRRRSKRPSPG
ncbi:hypothetical protein [Thiocystis violacea]|uniref:hypothetical protein n=1 Tax=Thiocystis violacea TaxID=13725 RepID=UPI001F5B613D|nr:hypothetical protein [Thiocystis violacea]